ncbi:hypothetical protein ES703_83264 [subsurface metagenome]
MTNRQDFDGIELMETIQASFDHLIRENPMGEARKDALRLDFNRKLKLEFHATKVTSNACSFASNLITYGREETC